MTLSTMPPSRRPLDDHNLDETLSHLLDFTKDGCPSQRAAVAGRRKGGHYTASASCLASTVPTEPQMQPLPPPLQEGRTIQNGRRRSSSDGFDREARETNGIAGGTSAAPRGVRSDLLFPAVHVTPRKERCGLRLADTRPLWLRTPPDGAENRG
eukprot:CAMPEP_0115851720 /NCGR_PEP_ID=MMETSP0287-20121206/12626_1 /TAXON_ID=412157 /ORGANISM="Chrysochromulina rotalis, Strain UIO044" /LENGTH=153 /DNA_ID=CAMNT_0003305759 /DNA_START=121 /DNA_END=582 /DNA_ORIENTATION=+